MLRLSERFSSSCGFRHHLRHRPRMPPRRLQRHLQSHLTIVDAGTHASCRTLLGLHLCLPASIDCGVHDWCECHQHAPLLELVLDDHVMAA